MAVFLPPQVQAGHPSLESVSSLACSPLPTDTESGSTVVTVTTARGALRRQVREDIQKRQKFPFPRIVKTVEVSYTTQSQGTCTTPVTNATECFLAAAKVQGSTVTVSSSSLLLLQVQGGGVDHNSTVSSSSLPPDCSLVKYQNGSTVAFFNEGESKAECGGGQVKSSSCILPQIPTSISACLDCEDWDFRHWLDASPP